MPPLLERESQLSQLMTAMAAARTGDGGMLLIGGEAGIGKSCPVERFARAPAPRAALIGTCDPVGTPPALAPLRELAGGLEPRLADELSSAPAPGPRLFEALAAAPTC
jgi:predicted ATPase